MSSIRELQLQYKIKQLTNKALAEMDTSNIMPPSTLAGVNKDYVILPDPDGNYETQQQALTMRKIDERRQFRNNLLTVMDVTNSEKVLNDPRLNEDEILKLNSVWKTFIDDLRKTYVRVNPNTFVDIATTYLYKVNEKEGNVVKNALKHPVNDFKLTVTEKKPDPTDNTRIIEEEHEIKFRVIENLVNKSLSICFVAGDGSILPINDENVKGYFPIEFLQDIQFVNNKPITRKPTVSEIARTVVNMNIKDANQFMNAITPQKFDQITKENTKKEQNNVLKRFVPNVKAKLNEIRQRKAE